MKNFKNETFVDLPLGDDLITGQPSYLDLIKICLNDMPEKGFTADEMRGRIKCIELLETEGKKEPAKGKDEVEFEIEDADAKVIVNCVSDHKWPTIHKEVLAFVDSVKEQLK